MYVPSTRNILSSNDVVFDEMFPSALTYMSQEYAEVMDMCPGVSHTSYDKSSKEKTGDIIIFAQFEEGNINYLKVMTMQKVATNTMTIKLLHHKLANNKGMQWIQAMILNMNLCLRIC